MFSYHNKTILNLDTSAYVLCNKNKGKLMRRQSLFAQTIWFKGSLCWIVDYMPVARQESADGYSGT